MASNAIVDSNTALPRNQVACVIFVQICESLNINVLFPFLAFMVEDFGYTGNNLGYYAGFLAAAFCSAQFFSSILWGIISDRYGRKPAVVAGVLGGAVGMLVFGLSTTYTQAICGRMLSGLLSGNLGVLKSFLTEITDDTNRGAGFSYMTLAWSIGTVVAPLAGGLLSRPPDSFPKIFSVSYPYLLPCLLCVCFNVFSAVFCAVYMEETKAAESKGIYSKVALSDEASDASGVEMSATFSDPEKDRIVWMSSPKSVVTVVADETFSPLETANKQRVYEDEDEERQRLTDYNSDLSEIDVQDENLTSEDSVKFSSSILAQRQVVMTTALYGLLCMAYILYDETLPLFLKQSESDGGFGFSSSEIGFVLSICGFVMLFFSAYVLPKIAAMSKLWTFKIGTLAAIPLVLLWPALGLCHTIFESWLGRYIGPEEVHRAVMAVLIVICTGKYVLSCIAFTASMILINHSVLDKDLGKANGLGQSFAALARAVGPALGGIFWSLSLHNHFIFANFLLIAAVLLLCAFVNDFLPSSLDWKYSHIRNGTVDACVTAVDLSI